MPELNVRASVRARAIAEQRPDRAYLDAWSLRGLGHGNDRVRTILAALTVVGRNSGPEALWLWHADGLISDQEVRGILPHVWGAAEFPLACLGESRWLRLFRVSGFVSDDGRPMPTSPLTVYRGAAAQRWRGFSWTEDIDRARWFANRLERSGVLADVYTTSALPLAVLALINGSDSRGEAEVVVNPNRLRGRFLPVRLTKTM